MAASAGRDSGARGHSRAGRYGRSQTGTRVGRRQSPVLGHIGQGRQLPSRGHRGAVDGSVGAMAHTPRGAPGSGRVACLPRTTGGPAASLKAVVRLAHHRWAIEQQYAELKDELGLDHFEGRSFHGWHRHVVLTAIAYAFIQRERQRRRRHDLTFPQARAVITEYFDGALFPDTSTAPEDVAETGGNTATNLTKSY